MQEIKTEWRVRQDSNGLWRAEIRFLPVPEWEQGDGWRCCYMSWIKENAMKFAGLEE